MTATFDPRHPAAAAVDLETVFPPGSAAFRVDVADRIQGVLVGDLAVVAPRRVRSGDVAAVKLADGRLVLRPVTVRGPDVTTEDGRAVRLLGKLVGVLRAY